MTLKETQNLAKSIFRLLKVTEISFPIGRTNKGNLEIKFSQNTDNFDILLDSVPLPTASKINDENNITLKGLIEKYWFDQSVKTDMQVYSPIATVVTTLKNKGGRPKGSKNKTKPVEDRVNG